VRRTSVESLGFANLGDVVRQILEFQERWGEILLIELTFKNHSGGKNVNPIARRLINQSEEGWKPGKMRVVLKTLSLKDL